MKIKILMARGNEKNKDAKLLALENKMPNSAC
jgi:hypothetical protein